MPGRVPIEQAVEVARQSFATQTRVIDRPSRREFFDAVRRFEQVGFEVPETGDSDGFLFQWGPANWLPEPAFIIGVTRQLEKVGPDGEHEAYLHIDMAFNYALDHELDSLGVGSSWWFRSSGSDFSIWMDAVERDPIWQLVDSKTMREFAISSDEA